MGLDSINPCRSPACLDLFRCDESPIEERLHLIVKFSNILESVLEPPIEVPPGHEY